MSESLNVDQSFRLGRAFVEETEYFPVGIERYKEALRIAREKSLSNAIIGNIYFLMGEALLLNKDYHQAIEQLEKGRLILTSDYTSYTGKTARTANIDRQKISILSALIFLLGRAYHRVGKLEEARLYFKDSLRLFRRLKDKEKIAAVLTALGNLELQMNKLAQANIHLKEAKQYYQAKDRQERLTEVDKLLTFLPAAS